MSIIRLKERCRSCGGSGIYRGPGFYRRCWTCAGKGWVASEMEKPTGVPKDDDPREYKVYRRMRSQGSTSSDD